MPCFQYEKPDEWRLSKVKRSARSVSLVVDHRSFTGNAADSFLSESNVRLTCVDKYTDYIVVLLLYIISHLLSLADLCSLCLVCT